MVASPPQSGTTVKRFPGEVAGSETMMINMGPQHPSTHGVLRLVLELDGEIVTSCVPHVGYVHTGIEKTCEAKTYWKFLPLTDRIDYMAPLANNLAAVLAVEKILGCEVPPRAQAVRVLMSELTRIQSHQIWLGTHALDLGGMSAFFYCFRDREKILDLFEMASGVRLMTTYFRIGGLREDLPDGWIEKCREFNNEITTGIDEYESLLTENEIFLERTQGIGVLTKEDAIDFGVSGPSIRGSGVEWDLRKTNPYCGYENYDFLIPVGDTGDVYDRYLVRMEEMRQSVRIIDQCLDSLPGGPVVVNDRKISLPPREELKTSMESLIHHFKLVTEGIKPPPGEAYACVESPKGMYGCYVVSDGSNKPVRVHFRTPSFVNLQAFPKLLEGKLIADAVAIIGSIDIVLGEVDR